jgi:hypothetical protein
MDNPYANIDLYLTPRAHDSLDALVGRAARDSRPFERQIDFWWAGLCVGVALELKANTDEKAVKFATGAILQQDPSRIVQLELLALSLQGPGALDTPRMVIELAARYANGGCDWLASKIAGSPEPLLALYSELESAGMMEPRDA